MKNIIYTLLVLSFPLAGLAQVDRTKIPEPGPAPEIKLGDYETFTLDNGLKVFVVENHKLPRVSFSLTVDRDPIIEGNKAGYISIAGQLLRNGTTNRTKAELDEEIDFIGASISTSSTGVFASSLKKHTDNLLELMTDVLYNPAFPEEELEKIKKQTISGLQANKEDPGAIASNVRSVLRYGKEHPYGELTTEETVANIDLGSIRNYYNAYFKPNISYLAIVGDVDVKEAQKLAKKYFGKWEKGDVPGHKYETPQAPEKRIVAIVDRPQAVQSVINITYPVELKPGNPDVIKSRVMNTILGGGFSSNLMQNLREEHAYTYGAGSSLSSDELIGSFTASASVRNEVTDSAVTEFLNELNYIRQEDVDAQQLNDIKNYITGGFARSLESPQTIARFALNIEMYGLPKNYYANYLKNIEAVTVNDVKEMAQKYIKPDRAYVLVVGKASEIASGLEKFGEVKYYDIYGNEVEKSDNELPEGLTARQVIDDYIEAIGGEDRLKNVKDIRVVMEAETPQGGVKLESIRKAPDKASDAFFMNGALISKQTLDGSQYSVLQMGQKVPVDENARKDAKVKLILFPELYYEELGVKTELTGIEQVNGNKAYLVKVTYPSGSQQVHYFDVESGLKLKSVETIETPQGSSNQTQEYGDYEEVEGILVPQTRGIGLGPVRIDAKVVTLKINEGVSDEVFKQE